MERLYRHLEKPEVSVRNLDGFGGKFVFTNELECAQLNSNHARKNGSGVGEQSAGPAASFVIVNLFFFRFVFKTRKENRFHLDV